MTRSFRSVIALTTLALPLVTLGCTSNDKAPYSLTGSAQATESDWAARQRFTDDKGRYRPELAAQKITQR